MKKLLFFIGVAFALTNCSKDFPIREDVEPRVDTLVNEITVREIIKDTLVVVDKEGQVLTKEELNALWDKVGQLEVWTKDHEHEKDTIYLHSTNIDSVFIFNETVKRDSVWSIVEKHFYSKDTIEKHFHYHDTLTIREEITIKDTLIIEKTIYHVDTIYVQYNKNQKTLDYLKENLSILFSNENVTDYDVQPYYTGDIWLEPFITLERRYDYYYERDVYTLIIDLTPAYVDEAQLLHYIEFNGRFNDLVDANGGSAGMISVDTSYIQNQAIEFKTTWDSSDRWTIYESFPTWSTIPNVTVDFGSEGNVSFSYETEIRAYFDHGNNYVTYKKGELDVTGVDLPFNWLFR